jgi:hypothetical protein
MWSLDSIASLQAGHRGVKARGKFVKVFARWKEFKAEFDLESTVPIPGAEGTRESFPINGLCGVVAPAEASQHVFLE